jgi:NitT/TauT family transport system substrate-binding protein
MAASLLRCVVLLAALAAGLGAESRWIRLAVDDGIFVARLAESLGYFAEEGIEIVSVKITDFAPNDYELQAPLRDGRIDAVCHWFHHAVFGARHGLPITAVLMFNDAPGMKVLVAGRVKNEIRSAADFRGRRVAEGAGYGTKSMLNHLLTGRAGLPPRGYTPVFVGSAGRDAAVLAALRAGEVDLLTFEEPQSSALLSTGLTTTFFDLTNAESTRRLLGAPWPAQCLMVSPRLAAEHPEAVRRLVNAFARALRFIQVHSAEEIAARLPPDWFAGKDRAEAVNLLRATLPGFTRGNGELPAEGVALVIEAIERAPFDDSPAGRWRQTVKGAGLRAEELFDNRFARAAER